MADVANDEQALADLSAKQLIALFGVAKVRKADNEQRRIDPDFISVSPLTSTLEELLRRWPYETLEGEMFRRVRKEESLRLGIKESEQS